MTHTRHIPLDGVLNLRDLGGYPTPSGETSWRRMLRAASLHRLTDAEIEKLQDLGVVSVIDLRFDDEIVKEPNPFAGRDGSVTHVNVSLFAGLDPTNPQIVEAPDPLLALYKTALDERPDGFLAVMRAIIAAGDGGVLFHCTAGKDRTGMIAALLLDLAGVAREVIVADYVLTGDHIVPLVEATRAAVEAQGGDFAAYAPFFAAEAATMEAFLDHLHDIHGGARTYLANHGLTVSEIETLRTRLVPPQTAKGAA
jgi:protein-tyrosine phosphatase